MESTIRRTSDPLVEGLVHEGYGTGTEKGGQPGQARRLARIFLSFIFLSSPPKSLRVC
jgi:hypothetical protein